MLNFIGVFKTATKTFTNTFFPMFTLFHLYPIPFRLIFFCLLLNSNFSLFAQKADWEGDIFLPTYLDYQQVIERQIVNNPNQDFTKLYSHPTILLKWQVIDDINYTEHHSIFRKQVYDLIRDKKLNCFKDDSLTQPFYPIKENYPHCEHGMCWTGRIKEYTEIDETEFQANLLAPEMVSCYEMVSQFLLKEHLSYYKKEHKLIVELQAFAPMESRNSSLNGYKQVMKPLFWIKIEPLFEELKTTNPIIDFAWKQSHLNISELNLRSKQTLLDLSRILYQEVKDKKVDALSMDNVPFTQERWDEIFLHRADTISIVDPTTYKEGITIIKNRAVQPDSLHHLKLTQNLYWDKETGRMSIGELHLGLLNTIYDEEQKIKYRDSVFYIKGNVDGNRGQIGFIKDYFNRYWQFPF